MGSVYGQYCSRITGGVLFHSVFYSTTNPGTLAYNSYNRLGTTASHGCVRLNVADAKWIYDNCPSGTLVNIYDSNNPGPLGKPTPVKIDVNSKYRGWDPTDPNENNPWRKMAPKITGTRKITVERLAKAPNMKKGVTATDYKGKTVKVTMSGKINMKKAGKYRITYKAKDSLSNVTTKYSYVTVKDTKKPVVKAKKKTLTIKGNLSEKKLMKLIRQNVKATDSKEKLSSKYVTVNAKTLLKAMKSKKYGTYKVTVVAKDKAGNKSKKITIKVKYVNQIRNQVSRTTTKRMIIKRMTTRSRTTTKQMIVPKMTPAPETTQTKMVQTKMTQTKTTQTKTTQTKTIQVKTTQQTVPTQQTEHKSN